MKRAINNKSTSEKPVEITVKPVSAKIVETQKAVGIKKNSVVKAEKISKIPEKETIAKIPVKSKKEIVKSVSKDLKKEAVVKINAPIAKAKKTAAIVKPAKAEKVKIAPKVSIEKIKLPKIAVEKSKPKKEKFVSTVKEKKTKTIEKQPEIVVAPPVAEPKVVKKKLKPIGSAVVRGRNGRYDFEVFSLDAEIKDGSAIYVISKRVTDKSGRAHHKFVCIGQTESLLFDLKKHSKGKCIKQHKANVICLLREESEKNRLKIETDLREAHTIACNHQ